MKQTKRLLNMKSLLLAVALLLFAGMAAAQKQRITGTVISATTQAPVAGATVATKTSSVTTDEKGQFVIELTIGEEITITHVGMKPATQKIQNNSPLTIRLEESATEMEKVVVTGYQTIRRSDFTGAVSVAPLNETKDQASGSVLQNIQGRVPGLYITSSGDPSGAATRVNIRGINTLGNTNPLYVIDGVPTTDPNVLQFMDANAIESIQVLKDASAASIYGSRASNGVIVVTTKTGKGKINVQLNSSYAVQKYVRRYKMANTDQYGRILWQAAINDATNPATVNPNNPLYTYDWHRDGNGVAVLDAVHPVQFINGDPNYPSANTDWQDQVFQTGLTSQTSLTLSGSTDRINSLVDISYFDSKGMIITTGFKRVNLRINNTVNFFDRKLKIGENLMLTRTSSVPVPADAARSVIALSTDMLPILPVYTADGKFAGPLGAGFSDRANPVHMAQISKHNRDINNGVFGNLFIEATPVRNLVFKTNLGIDWGLARSNRYMPLWQEGFLSNTVNWVNQNEVETTNWIWTNTVTYQLTKGRSRANVLIGTEAIRNFSNSMGARRERFAIDNIDYYYLNAGTGPQTNSGFATESKLMSYFGNIAYAFDGKYLVSGTLRYDGSSKFGANNRFGIFPAASVGWVVNRESFMAHIKQLSNLKLRVGYGIVGNQAIGDYARFQLWRPDYSGTVGFFGAAGGTAYDITGADQGNLPSGFRATQAANPNLKWESTAEINAGLDFGFFDNKLSGSFDFFSKETKDILTTPPNLGVMGEGASRSINGATMRNKGWEATIGYTSNKKGDWNFGVRANFSHFADRITYLPASVVRNYPGNVEQSIIGHSLTSIFGYVTDGLFQNQEEVNAHATQPGKGIGRIRYKDLNKDGKIDVLDQTWLGTTLPKLIYGISGDISYKNFSLSLFVTGVSGVLVNDMAKLEKNSFLGLVAGMNKGVSLLDAWTPQNTSSTIPMLSFANNNTEGRTSDYTLVNGSYVKLQTAQLNYSIPRTLTGRVGLQSARVYILGENLLLFYKKNGTSAFTGPDPETPVALTGGYPKPVRITFGLDITF